MLKILKPTGLVYLGGGFLVWLTGSYLGHTDYAAIGVVCMGFAPVFVGIGAVVFIGELGRK